MLLREKWLRCELTCDQAVLLSFLFRGEGKRKPFLFPLSPKKKRDRAFLVNINGLKKNRKGRGLDRSLY